MTQIIRLRGTAVPVWPGEKLAPLIREIVELRDQHPLHCKQCSPSCYCGTYRSWVERSAKAWRDAATVFAAANGWTLSADHEWPAALLPPGGERAAFDERLRRAGGMQNYRHAQWLAMPDGALVGLVAHLYASIDLTQVPERVDVFELPASWYNPSRTRAYLLLRATRERASPTGGPGGMRGRGRRSGQANSRDESVTGIFYGET